MKTDYQKTAKKIRKQIIETSFLAQSSHIGSALSCVDILTMLYFKILKIDPKKPTLENRDRFILSKGHAALALYSTLAERGFFAREKLKNYCQDGSKLAGHSTKNCLVGVEVSTGSLGHGLPMGIGMALAGKKDNKKYRVFVLLSDGELNEGSNWEAFLFASHHKLDNLIAIVDYNKFQAFGKANEVLNLEPLKEKMRAFDWSVRKINGHNFDDIEKSLSNLPQKNNRPTIIVADTKKGAGISFMEEKLEWHYKSLNKEQCESALKELS